MTGNIVMPSKFAKRLDADALKSLEDSGIAVDHSAELDDLDLADPADGEITIGVVTDEEAKLFVSYHQAFAEYDGVMRDINSDMLRTAADRVKQGSFDVSQLNELTNERVSEDDIKTIARLRRQVDMLRSFFYWHLSERLDAHHHVLGIRSGGRVVRSIAATNGH